MCPLCTSDSTHELPYLHIHHHDAVSLFMSPLLLFLYRCRRAVSVTLAVVLADSAEAEHSQCRP